MRNRRASTTFRTSSGISLGIAASTITKRSQTLNDDVFPFPFTRNFVPGFVLAGTFKVSFFPSRVSNGTSVPSRKSKNGMDRLMVTSRDSGAALSALGRLAECWDCPNGDQPPNPPPENRSEKSNVWDCPLPCEAHENPRKRSSKPENPALPLPGNPPKPPASADQNVSKFLRFFSSESTSYAADTSLNLASLALSPLFLSGWCFIASLR